MSEHRDFAFEIARQAGKLMRDSFGLGMSKTWKGDASPVTETDLAINELVINAVKEQFPTHGVLAEEKSAPNTACSLTWVCDPVDGTLPFSHGVPIATFGLALVDDGQVILGLAYDPFSDRLFHAEKGQGAFVNNSKISVSPQPNLDQGVVDVGATSQFELTGVLEHLSKYGAKTTKFYSALFVGALTAAGELRATVFGGRNPWDSAVSKILIEEAGGVATDIFGHDQRYDRPTQGLIGANEEVHAQLVKIMSEIMGDQRKNS